MPDGQHFGVLAGTALLSIPAGWLLARLCQWQTGISRPYPGPMILAALVSGVWTALLLPPDHLLAITLMLGWTLCALAAIDLIAFRLPDMMTLPLIAGGLVLSVWLPDRDPAGHLIAAAAAYWVLHGISWLYRRFRGREGLGLGDAKLAAAAGAWLGWQSLPSVVLIACTAAFLWIGIAVMIRGKEAAGEHIAFGVPLSFGFWLVWLYGPPF